MIAELTRLGVRLRVEDGRIFAKPLSAVPPELREAVRAHKAELLVTLCAERERPAPASLDSGIR